MMITISRGGLKRKERREEEEVAFFDALTHNVAYRGGQNGISKL